MRNDNLLEKILSPYNLADFIENYYGKEVLHMKRNNENYYDSIFSAPALDRILCSNVLTDIDLKVSKLNTGIHKSEYCVYDELNKEFEVNIGKIMELFNEGGSIIIDNISKYNRAVLDLEIEISNKIGFVKNIATNVYLTPADSQAFPLHYDIQEIFIIQIAGTKTWEIFEDSKEFYPLDLTLKHIISDSESKQGNKITLHPGDFIYMPRGVAHNVYTNDESSLHLTISLYPYTTTDLFKEFQIFASKNDENFRKNLTRYSNVKEFQDLFYKSLNLPALGKLLGNLKNKNRYNELYEYSNVINSVFEEIDFNNISLMFRNKVVIQCVNEQTLIQYGVKKVEIEGDFSNLSMFLENDTVFKLDSMLPFFEYDVSKELIYLLLKEGIVYKI